MNNMSKILLLKNTKFENWTGLPDKSNKSCCLDLGKLVSIANKISLISDIVSKKYY